MNVHGYCDNAMHNDDTDNDNVHTGIFETDPEFGAYTFAIRLHRYVEQMVWMREKTHTDGILMKEDISYYKDWSPRSLPTGNPRYPNTFNLKVSQMDTSAELRVGDFEATHKLSYTWKSFEPARLKVVDTENDTFKMFAAIDKDPLTVTLINHQIKESFILKNPYQLGDYSGPPENADVGNVHVEYQGPFLVFHAHRPGPPAYPSHTKCHRVMPHLNLLYTV